MSTQVISRPSPVSVGSNFRFIDNIRFITMCALFLEHNMIMEEYYIYPYPRTAAILTRALIKFGSIALFLASGYLLGSGNDRQGALTYLQKRLRRVFLPWLFWLTLFCAALTLLNSINGRMPLGSPANAWHVIVRWVGFAFGWSYWFVPNLMVSLCCYLLVRQVVGEKASGIIWAAASIFYAANIYLRWVQPAHQQAWLGFVFYLWLGSFLGRNPSRAAEFLDRISYKKILSVLFVLWLACLFEYRLIERLCPSSGPENTIRISNQLYSVGVVVLLAKFRKKLWPGFVDVRQDTFGLYLLQMFGVYGGSILLAKIIHNDFLKASGGPLFHLAVWIGWTAVVYGGCLAVTKLLAGTNVLRWTVGLTPVEATRQQALVHEIRSPRGSERQRSAQMPAA